MAFAAVLMRSRCQSVVPALRLAQSHSALRCRIPVLAACRLSSHDDLSDRSRETETRKSADIDRNPSSQQRIRGLLRDYGATAFVFYMTVSTTSLTTCYMLVSYGVDVQAAITYLGIAQTSRLASGASTFVIAYACHKLLLPLRLAITATATPLIVRYLQRLGWIKKADVAQDSSKDVHV